MFQILLIASTLCHQTWGFWELASTTMRLPRTDDTARTSFFRWQWVSFPRWWFWYWDWTEIDRRRRLNVIAGISIDFLCLSTAVILNRRILISSYNYLDPYMNRQDDLRIWALGRRGMHNTPYRYRVYRVTRMFPLSLNEEHCHGPRCTHQPRHDICIIISLDQIYIYPYQTTRWHYAYRGFIAPKFHTLRGEVWFAGSGYEYMQHVIENYKIFYALIRTADVVDCSRYLPKWWGKFICMRNLQHFAGIQNGGGLFADDKLMGIGCFEIRVNDDRIFVFTDIRYYHSFIYHYASIQPGQYYEYAYPQWGVKLFWISDGHSNNPYIPSWNMMHDLYPLGK